MRKIDFNYFLVILENIKKLSADHEYEFSRKNKQTLLKRLIEIKRKMFDSWKKMTPIQREGLLQRFQVVESIYDRRKEFEELRKVKKGG